MTQSTIILEAFWPWHSDRKTAKLMPRAGLAPVPGRPTTARRSAIC